MNTKSVEAVSPVEQGANGPKLPGRRQLSKNAQAESIIKESVHKGMATFPDCRRVAARQERLKKPYD
jgi:hypothetical protein